MRALYINGILLRTAFLLALCSLVVSCQRETASVISIPAGSASQMLKEFARQTQMQIIYDARSVEGVITKPVEGRFDPGQALDRMLKGTPLCAKYDSGTGAYAIVLRDPPPLSIRRLSGPVSSLCEASPNRFKPRMYKF